MIIDTLAYHAVSLWIWGSTFDLSHTLLCVIILFCLFHWFFRIGIARSIALGIGLPVMSYGIYTLLVIGIIVDLLHWEYIPSLEPELYMTHAHALIMCIAFGSIQCALQLGLLGIMRLFIRYASIRYCIAVIVSNACATWISYVGIRLFMWYAF